MTINNDDIFAAKIRTEIGKRVPDIHLYWNIYNLFTETSEKVQAKTFKKALNGYLGDLPIIELFNDLRDGKRLLFIIKQFCDSNPLVQYKI